MGLETPAWLWLLLPWAALLVLTLRAYRKKVTVPFIGLWPREEVREDRRRAWRPPPMRILLLLAALLLAIAALTRPTFASGAPRISRITIVLDRGVSMLAGERLREATQSAVRALAPLLDVEAQITIIDPLQPDQLVGPGALKSALDRPATAMDLQAQFAAAVDRAESAGHPVLVVSDRSPDQVIVASPSSRPSNVGIVRATANAGECWLTLRNDSDGDRVAVRLFAGGQSTRHEVGLPTRGESRDFSLPCPEALPLRIELEITDALADDNLWWILPEEVPAKLSVGPAAPEWLTRFAQSYSRAKPPGKLSPDVQISVEAGQIPRAVIFGIGDEPVALPAEGLLPDHPLLTHVVLPDQVLVGGPLPPGDWQTLLEAESRPLLAASESTHCVWIGFRPQGEITPDYLILLSNAVAFCSGVETSSSAPARLAPEWQAIEGPALAVATTPGLRAGLYRKGDLYHAINVPAPQLQEDASPPPLNERLAAIADRSSRINPAPWLWTAAAALTAIAATTIRPFVVRAQARK